MEGEKWRAVKRRGKEIKWDRGEEENMEEREIRENGWRFAR